MPAVRPGFRSTHVSSDDYALVCEDPAGPVKGTYRAIVIVNRADDGRIYDMRAYSEPDVYVQLLIDAQKKALAEHCRTSPAHVTFVRGTKNRSCMQWRVGPPVGEKTHYLVYENIPVVSRLTTPISAREIMAGVGAIANTAALNDSYECIASNGREGIFYATRVPKPGGLPFKPSAWKFGHLITQGGSRVFFLNAIQIFETRKWTKTELSRIPGTPLTDKQSDLERLLRERLLSDNSENEETVNIMREATNDIRKSITYHAEGDAALLRWGNKPYQFYAAYVPKIPNISEIISTGKENTN